MKKTFFIIFSLLILPVYAEYVNVEDALNVRDSSSINAEIIDQLFKNDFVTLLYKKDGWSYIRYTVDKQQKYGWVKDEFLSKKYITAVTGSNDFIEMLIEAQTAYNKKQYDEALHYINLIIQKNPQFSDFYAMRSVIYIELKKFQLALVDINKAIELNNSITGFNDSNYVVRAACYVELGEFQNALNDLYKVSNINAYPAEIQLLYNYYNGVAKQNLGQYSSAINNFNNSIRIITANPQLVKQLGLPIEANVYIFRANCYSKSGLYNLAQQDLNKAKQLCLYDTSSYCAEIRNINSGINNF